MPPEVAARLAAIRDSGRLKLYAGLIEDAVRTGEASARMKLKLRNNEPMRLEVARVINCTGSETDPAKSVDPLMQRLIHDGLAASDPLSLGLVTDETGAIISADGSISDRVFTLGPLRRAMLWESTAMPEIRAQSSALAKALLSSLNLPLVETGHA